MTFLVCTFLAGFCKAYLYFCFDYDGDTSDAIFLKIPTDSQYYRSNSFHNAASCETTTRTKRFIAVISCLLHSQRRREENSTRLGGKHSSLNVFDETRLLVRSGSCDNNHLTLQLGIYFRYCCCSRR